MIDILVNGISIITDHMVLGSLCMVIGYMNAILIKVNFMDLDEAYVMKAQHILVSLRMVNGKDMGSIQVQQHGHMRELGRKGLKKDLGLESFEL